MQSERRRVDGEQRPRASTRKGRLFRRGGVAVSRRAQAPGPRDAALQLKSVSNHGDVDASYMQNKILTRPATNRLASHRKAGATQRHPPSRRYVARRGKHCTIIQRLRDPEDWHPSAGCITAGVTPRDSGRRTVWYFSLDTLWLLLFFSPHAGGHLTATLCVGGHARCRRHAAPFSSSFFPSAAQAIATLAARSRHRRPRKHRTHGSPGGQ